MSKNKQGFSLRARLTSIKDAMAGIGQLLKNEHNSRVHLLATVIVIWLGVYHQITRIEWGLLFIVVTLVWMAEAFNTALEYLCDRVSPEHNELIGLAKDMAAAAVLIAAIGAVLVGGLVFIPYLL